MNWELIGWIVVGIIISEIIFVCWMYFREEDVTYEANMPWIFVKFCSFFGGFILIFVHLGIVGGMNYNLMNEMWGNLNYINLLYEGFILFGILILFGINKLIVNKINKSK